MRREGGEGETTEKSYQTPQRASLPKTMGLRPELPGGGHSRVAPVAGRKGTESLGGTRVHVPALRGVSQGPPLLVPELLPMSRGPACLTAEPAGALSSTVNREVTARCRLFWDTCLLPPHPTPPPATAQRRAPATGRSCWEPRGSPVWKTPVLTTNRLNSPPRRRSVR